jgi:hypothetical protein
MKQTETETEAAQEALEVTVETPRRTRPAANTPPLPRELPGSFTTIRNLAPNLPSSPPGLPLNVKNWGTGPQEEVETENIVEAVTELEVKIETELDKGINPEHKVSGNAAIELNNENSAAEPEQREAVAAADEFKPTIVVGDTVMSNAEPEVPKTGEESVDIPEITINDNIQHNFTSRPDGETETHEDTQNTQLTNDSGYSSQVPAYASQEEFRNLIAPMDDEPPRPRAGSSRYAAPPADSPRNSGLRTDFDPSPRSPYSDTGSPPQTLGKRRRGAQVPNGAETEAKRIRLATTDAQQTANALAARVAFAAAGDNDDGEEL